MTGGIAVVGGGVFGVTAALEAARDGRHVVLFEERNDLLLRASGINQYRLHRGYHYPRSERTARESMTSRRSFLDAYGEAVVDVHPHFYAIAAEGSRVGPDQYLDFLDRMELDYRRAWFDGLERHAVDLCLCVPERLLDPAALRRLCRRRLEASSVEVRLGTRAEPADLEEFDGVVLATYARINDLLEPLAGRSVRLQFEVCEKPVARLPAPLRGVSVVVLDGPFMCFDPVGTSGRSVCGNVVHAIHARNVGTRPRVPDSVASMLDRGVVPDPEPTRFPRFVEAAAEFFPDVRDARHVGSMFTIRTVLPDVEDTDERPTLVERVEERIVTVLSGKIGTCVSAAERAGELLWL